MRVYSPEPFSTTALTFREHGPHARFDHHRPDAEGRPRADSERGVLYAGEDLVCSLGEFFADSVGVIEKRGVRVALLTLTDEIVMLDLRGTAALGLGTTPAIAGISQRKTTQAWARYLYAHPGLMDVRGLVYAASNSGRDAFAIYERAAAAVAVKRDYPLGDPVLDGDLQLAAFELRLAITH